MPKSHAVQTGDSARAPMPPHIAPAEMELTGEVIFYDRDLGPQEVEVVQCATCGADVHQLPPLSVIRRSLRLMHLSRADVEQYFPARLYPQKVYGHDVSVRVYRPQDDWDRLNAYLISTFGKACCPPGSICAGCCD